MSEQLTDDQLKLLKQDLDPRFISNRKGGGNITLKYIEGHDAIDQANRIFGYGNWSYRPLSCEQCILRDPLTKDAVGIVYKAQVELMVRGCGGAIVEVGSQPVATWNVEDCILICPLWRK
jgi:recombination DNA repair RAD52 pathway protein